MRVLRNEGLIEKINSEIPAYLNRFRHIRSTKPKKSLKRYMVVN